MKLRPIITFLVITGACLSIFWLADGVNKPHTRTAPVPAAAPEAVSGVAGDTHAGLPPLAPLPGIQADTAASRAELKAMRSELMLVDAEGYQTAAPPVGKTVKTTHELAQLLGWATWCVRQELDPASLAHDACKGFLGMRPQWVEMLEARARMGDAVAQRWLDSANAALKGTVQEREIDDAMVEAGLANWWADPKNRP